jgi:hypothetical protein
MTDWVITNIPQVKATFGESATIETDFGFDASTAPSISTGPDGNPEFVGVIQLSVSITKPGSFTSAPAITI